MQMEPERLRDLLSMSLVGALWGCTNPILRKGSSEASSRQPPQLKQGFLKSSLLTFMNVKVWLPYLLNQSGSIVFYVLLANSELSLAVPICNALALVFSFFTSACLGESVDKPIQTFLGSVMILLGVAVCVSSQEKAIENFASSAAGEL